MLNEDEINALADIFQDRFDKANRKILEYIGSMLKEIGELTPSRARKIQQMYKYGEDLDTITQYLAEASGQSIDDIEALYEKVAEEGYNWSKPFYEAKGIKQIPFKENKDVQRIIKAMCAVTGKSLKNISRTTAIGVNTAGGFKPVGSFYKETIDSAITAVITGTEDYNSTIRRAVKELGSGGLKIQYESGYRRRLDSAVRQNVLDGVRYVTHEIAVKNGEEFGADGYEISAHSACAPDHLPYQGRQYSKKEYEAIQESLARPIGQWNCGHTAFPIVLGVSHRAYTDKELKAFEQNSNEKITIEGREYTRYECTQLQRKLETKLRYAREEKALYKAVGDKELVNGATEKIRLLSNKYADVSKKADLPMRKERTRGVIDRLNFENTKAENRIKRIEEKRIADYNKNKEKIRNIILSDDTNRNINKGAQNKHIPSSKGYISGRSYILGSAEDAQTLVNRYAGTGEIKLTASGEWTNKEFVYADDIIGVAVNPETLEKTETHRFAIHYGKKGTHIVPVKEEKKQ